MNIHYNLLPQDVLDLAHREVEEINASLVWRPSSGNWNSNLIRNVVGLTNITWVGNELHRMVEEWVRPLVPSYKTIEIQHSLWYPLSGIDMHSDGGSKFSCTIYMNTNWDINWGGLFVYHTKKDGLKAHYPEYNSMVINNDNSYHLVTTISPLAPYPRHTLQIWSKT